MGGFDVKVVLIVPGPGAVAVLLVHIDIIVRGLAHRGPGDGDFVRVAVSIVEIVGLGGRRSRVSWEDGILSGEVGLEEEQAADGPLVKRELFFGGVAGVKDGGVVLPGGLVHGDEVAAVADPGDEIVSFGLILLDLFADILHGGIHGEGGLSDIVEAGRDRGGDGPVGEEGVPGILLTVADVALGVQPVTQGPGIQDGGVIGAGVAHEGGDGGDETARASHGVQIT